MKKIARKFAFVSAAVVAAATASTSAQALTFILNPLSAGVSQGTQAYEGFAAAAHYWSSVLTDDVEIRLDIDFTTQNFAPTTLGDASSTSNQQSQLLWRTAITADATTNLDTIAVANLATFTNPNVLLNTALQKALGTFTGNPNTRDARIRFNSARPFDFDTRDGFTGVSSDFISVAVHEIGHALGFTSAVASNTTNNSRPSNTDMFRYKNGAWNITWGEDPYFSIDGGASEVFGRSDFSPGSDNFQTSHWQAGGRIHDGVRCTILTELQIGILDPTGGLCQEGIVTAQDLALFDAIGWDLNIDILANPDYRMRTSDILQNYLNAKAVPEPTTWAMMLVGFGMIGVAARRGRYRYRLSAV